MHQKVQESHTETFATGQGTKQVETKTLCADGLCQQETVTMIKPGVANAAPQMPMPGRMARLDAMMERIMGSMRMPMAPVVHVEGPPPPMPMRSPMPVMVVSSSPNLRGMLARISGGAPRYTMAPVMQSVPVPPPQYHKFSIDGLTKPLLAAALAASSLIFAMILAALKYGQSRVSAREVGLRSLAEPLAPTDASPKLDKAATSALPTTEEFCTSAVAKEYLQSLYTTAQANVENQAVNQYMGFVYMRALV